MYLLRLPNAKRKENLLKLILICRSYCCININNYIHYLHFLLYPIGMFGIYKCDKIYKGNSFQSNFMQCLGHIEVFINRNDVLLMFRSKYICFWKVIRYCSILMYVGATMCICWFQEFWWKNHATPEEELFYNR